MRADTIPARLLRLATSRDPAYYVKSEGIWQATDFGTYVQEVRRAGRALMALGCRPGDKVAMLGFNRPEWAIFNLAALCIGGVGVGIYTAFSAKEVQYVVHHAEVRAILLEDELQWATISRERGSLPLLRHIIMMKAAPAVDAPGVMSWEEFNARGDAVRDRELDERVDALMPEALAAMSYTSGTTGHPKGVMLSHRNLMWTAMTLSDVLDGSSEDFILSYLPLSHIAEQMFTIHLPIYLSLSVYYAESIDKVADNLREVQPTIFFGAPRIWERFHQAIAARLGGARGGNKAIVDWVQSVAGHVSTLRNQGKEPGHLTRLKYTIADYLLLSKLKPAIGLKNARLCVSGAAPIAREILEFFASLDIIIHELYGQSEGTGSTSFNLPGKSKFGTVGTAMPGIQVKIAEDGEILVKGPNVFMGYHKDQRATDEALKDGWLLSGDLGVLDEQGFLTITGRKKDIIITAGGQNITPSPIEAALKNHPPIREAVVIGDGRRYLTALITLDEEAVTRFKIEHGVDEDRAVDEIPELRAMVQDIVDKVNANFSRVEAIKKFTILRKSFTIEGGELTPTLEVKRSAIIRHHADEIEAMYRDA